ncbi:MAG: SGNH/GDSL hydrolase family protein [Eubacteriales bacterium]
MDFCDIFKGTVQVRCENGIYTPLRFTDKQFARYKDIPRCCYPYASSGVKMEFITDEPCIKFTYNFGAVWLFNGQPTFDIYENDGLNQIVYGITDSSPHEITYNRLHVGSSKITIYLPVDAETYISGIKIGNYMITEPRAKKLLLLGDSISQGLMVRYSSLCYAALIERYYHFDMLNQGVGGDIYDATALDETLPFNPDYVIIALGTNDVYFIDDYDVIQTNINDYYEKINKLYGTKKVIVITPPYQVGIENNPHTYELLKKITDKIILQASVYHFDVVCGFDLVPHDPAFFTDPAHPNDLGFSQYAFNLISRLKLL